MSLLIANLDAEVELAGGTPGDLSPKAAAMAVTAGSLMRALAMEGDAIWTLGPVDAVRVPAMGGLPDVTWCHGPLEETPGEQVGPAWAETASVARRRARARAHEREGVDPSVPDASVPDVSVPDSSAESWWRTVRRIAPAAPGLVARLHHRAFHLELAGRLGLALPGAALIRSVEEWAGHLATGGAAASPTGRWVLKAGLSAAGRSRLVGAADHRSGSAREQTAAAVARLLALHGPLLFEPWLDREEDLGALGLVDEVGVRWLGWHRQLVEGDLGRFTGVSLHVGEPEVPRRVAAHRRELSRDLPTRLQEVLGAVGEALRETGYRGPFGIDACVHRRADGSRALHAFGELNVRFTMGHLTRALAERLARARRWPTGTTVTLRLGGRELEGPDRLGRAAAGAGVPEPYSVEWLLRPGATGEPGARLCSSPVP